MNNSDNHISINSMLNDDCLSDILKFFSPGEKLKLRKVCIRWKVIIDQIWFHFNELKITNLLDLNKFLGYDNTSIETIENNKIIGTLIRKYGKYIKYIKLTSFNQLKYEMNFVLEIVAQYCKNIVEINLESYDNIINDISLRYIFINNKSLQIVKLRGNVIYGDCLRYLNQIVTLKTLELYNLDIEHIYYLTQSITKLNKNLNKLIIHNYKHAMISLIHSISLINDTFMMNELELVNFNAFDDSQPTYLINFSKVLLKLKNLSSIKLKGFILNNNQIINSLIQLNYIHTISLKMCLISSKNLSKLINSFKTQLISLSLNYNNNEKDINVIKAISYCSKLKYLYQGQFCGYDFTDKNIYYLFGKLKNLEELNFENTSVTNDLFFNLINLKNLRVINVNGCNNITNEGLRNLKYMNNLNCLYINRLNDDINYSQLLSFFKNLKILDCRNAMSLTNQDIYLFIKENLDLELLYLNNCWYVTKELVDILTLEFRNCKLKDKRKKQLRIFVRNTNISQIKFNIEGLHFIDNMILLDNNYAHLIN